MNELQLIKNLNREKFVKFIIGLIFKVAGYFILFYLDWKIAIAVFLVDRGSDLLSKSV
jgi:hypothetical protein